MSMGSLDLVSEGMAMIITLAKGNVVLASMERNLGSVQKNHCSRQGISLA